MKSDLMTEFDWLIGKCVSMAESLRSARALLAADKQLEKATAAIAAIRQPVVDAQPAALPELRHDSVDRTIARVSAVPVLSDVEAQRSRALAAVRALVQQRPDGPCGDRANVVHGSLGLSRL
jgi:hypothetical protein